jgi:hypothetical protein
LTCKNAAVNYLPGFNKLTSDLKNKKTTPGSEYARLRDFYIEIQELGIAKKPEYDLPLLDTIGRKLYEFKHSVSRRKIF